MIPQPLGFSWNRPDSQVPSLASTQEKEQWFPKGGADYLLLYWVQWALWQPALLFPWRGLCDPGLSNQPAQLGLFFLHLGIMMHWAPGGLPSYPRSSSVMLRQVILEEPPRFHQRKYSSTTAPAYPRLEDLLQDSMVGVASVGCLLLGSRVNLSAAAVPYPWSARAADHCCKVWLTLDWSLINVVLFLFS